MTSLLELDRQLAQDAAGLEHPGLTALFVVLSAWWVKGPLLLAVALGYDLWHRRAPLAFFAALFAALGSSLAVGELKTVFARQRPPEADPGLGALVAVPGNPSFPSGHAATAFAAATAIAVLCPRLRVPVLVLAAAVALSRVYLRVHFPLDVLAGALLGAGFGTLAAFAALRLAASRAAREPAGHLGRQAISRST